MKLMVPFMMVVVVLIILVRGKRREFVNYFFALGEIPKSNSSNREEHEYKPHITFAIYHFDSNSGASKQATWITCVTKITTWAASIGH